jgi:hypothetical protein
MVASVLLGGGTRGGFLSDVILQLVAIPVLLAASWTIFDTPLTRATRLALVSCLAILAIPLLQLIPLPPFVWSALPNREVAAAGFTLVGSALPWMPLSLAPTSTWLAALSLLAPIALFIGIVLLDRRERRAMSVVVIALAIISVFLGLLQVAQGPDSPLRFFAITNPSEAVGFFANRNHFAALLYAATLFAAAWTVNLSIAAGPKLKDYDAAALVMLLAGFIAVVVLVAGQIMARSRAGLGLAMVALFGAFALAVSDRRAASGITPAKLLVGAIALAFVFALQYALFRLLERFEADPLDDARIVFARNTIAAARAFMPFGSGLGSFVPVYGLFEKPADALANTYANHAHNDIVELWLETGVVGLALMGLFVIWLVARSVRVWRAAPGPGSLAIDQLLARAATLVIALLLAHSFVDYPLRTGAMMAVMAFSCALLVDSPLRTRSPVGAMRVGVDTAASPRNLRGPPAVAPPPPVAASPRPAAPVKSRRVADQPARPPSPDDRWGGDIEWPDAWRKRADNPPSNDPPASRKPHDD